MNDNQNTTPNTFSGNPQSASNSANYQQGVPFQVNQPQPQQNYLEQQPQQKNNNYENINFYNNPYYQNQPYNNSVSDNSYYGTAPQNSYYQNNTGYYNQYNQTGFNRGNFAYQNNAQNYILSQQRFLKLREQKRELSKFASVIAMAMLGFLIVSAFIGVFLEIFGLYDLYDSSVAFSSGVGIFYSIFSIGIPFFIADKLLKKHTTKTENPYSKPNFSTKTILVILLAVSGSILSMYFTNLISVFLEMFGLYFYSSSDPEITSVVDVIALFIGTAIVPPLIEEFAMRKVVMQPLRKYGNGFAIITSAFLFGIFHGTPSQIPFAFLSGLFIGYAVIATNSIWTGVIIHVIINSLSCSYFSILYFTDETTADTFYSVTTIMLIILGLFAMLIYYVNHYKNIKSIFSDNGLSDYSNGEKFRKFIFSPLMIITIFVFLLQACSLITTQSGVYT